ncbi:MAG: nucleotidyltransferase family protein [Nitrospirales bacterium]|nr:nucleotidyltransferase family protein [Nitrospirales bacterium]
MTYPAAWEQLLAIVAAGDAPPPAFPEDDWDDLLPLAQRHGLLALLYRRCCVDCPRPLPVRVEELIHQAYLRGTVLNTLAYNQLGTLLRAMNESGIPAIVLKGACLAEVVYGDVAVRPMSDLDLLVRPEDLPRIDDLSRSLGYIRPDGDVSKLADTESHHHFPVFKLSNGLPLEWHWTISHQDRHGVSIAETEIEALWSRSVSVTVAGVGTRMLNPEDLLLHQCLHLANNHLFAWGGLKGLIDISLILEKNGAQLDFGVIERRAQAWGSWRGVALALSLTHNWLGAPLPEAVTCRVQAALPTDDVIEWIREKMRQLAPASMDGAGPTLPANARWQEIPAMILRNLLPPPATMARLYNRPARSRRIYFDYPGQIAAVIRKGGTLAYRLVGGDREKHVVAVREAALRRWLREEPNERC